MRTWRVALLGLTLATPGCAAQRGLKSPGVERVRLATINVVRNKADVVDARCTHRKVAWKKCQVANPPAECEDAPIVWDDGQKGDVAGRRARCCTVYYPKRTRPFSVYVSEGDDDCWVHEFCHVQEFLSPRPDHSKCHDFGLGRPKKSL